MNRLYFLLILFTSAAQGQALRDINSRYQYDPGEAFTFVIKPVRLANEWQIFYKLQLRDTSGRVADYQVQWDSRSSLSEKTGSPLAGEVSIGQSPIGNGTWGKIVTPLVSSPYMLVAKITNTVLKRAWLFYEVLDPKYPVNGALYTEGHIVFNDYIKIGDTVSVGGDNEAKGVAFYRDDFPAAAPAFSETLGKVSSSIKVDSSFNVLPQQPLTFSQQGLYLVQKDTSAAEGFTFRVGDDYPRLAKVQNLADPLIYICTKQEFDRIKLAKGDKKAFDKIILSITGDTERAQKFMRSYFRRVELANRFFTSYKEGWKTDRGLIYIVFGLPDEVFKFSDREVWKYDNENYKVSFDFAKAPSLFDPKNYVLLRDKKYRQTYYEVIDLWRNARF